MTIRASNKAADFDVSRLDLSALTPAEQKELKLLLAEAKIRNLELPLEVVDRKSIIFPKTALGYFRKNDGKEFIPVSESQESFINSMSWYDLYYGSRGCGKTACGSQKAMKKIEQGYSGTIINPVFEDFKNSTWEEFRKWIPAETVVPKHRYRLRPEYEPQKPFTIVFRNGAKVLCKGLKNPNSARGPNVNWLWYDEGGSDPDGEGWRIAIAGVRVGENPQAWVTTTPNGILHWLHDFFIAEEKQELIKKILIELDQDLGDREMVSHFYGTMEENKKNLEPGFYASMKTAYSGWQEQQEIEGKFVSQGGALGDSNWFNDKMISRIPENIKVNNRIRYWDLAASEKTIVRGKKKNDPDKTVGTLFSYAKRKENNHEEGNYLEELSTYRGKDVFFIEDQVSGYWKWIDIKEKIWETALNDGYFVKIRIEQEPGSGGKNQVAELKSFIEERCREMNVPIFDVEGHRPEGDKVQRANLWFSEAKDGIIYVVKSFWNTNFFRILDSFPHGKHDDEVDSVSGARLTCAPIQTWKKIAFKSI